MQPQRPGEYTTMSEKNDQDLDETAPLAKRTGRDGVQPGEEFVDEMRVNRFEETPEPEEK